MLHIYYGSCWDLLISDFDPFMLIKVFCILSMLPPAVCLRGGGGGGGATGLQNKGGGSNRLPVEFPQVQASRVILL